MAHTKHTGKMRESITDLKKSRQEGSDNDFQPSIVTTRKRKSTFYHNTWTFNLIENLTYIKKIRLRENAADILPAGKSGSPAGRSGSSKPNSSADCFYKCSANSIIRMDCILQQCKGTFFF